MTARARQSTQREQEHGNLHLDILHRRAIMQRPENENHFQIRSPALPGGLCRRFNKCILALDFMEQYLRVRPEKGIGNG